MDQSEIICPQCNALVTRESNGPGGFRLARHTSPFTGRICGNAESGSVPGKQDKASAFVPKAAERLCCAA